jgi:3-hydroxyacyl-[acyl-carrier-protein] dehydratase
VCFEGFYNILANILGGGGVVLTNIEIQNIIPHRYPFLLVDKIVGLEPGKKAVGIKNVTANEPFFQGHFPGNPIMPGVLIVEALAQTACVAGLMLEENKGKLGVFTGIDSMKFRRQVVPGDTLKLEAEFLIFKMGMGKVKVTATVDGQIAAEGEIRFAMVDAKK